MEQRWRFAAERDGRHGSVIWTSDDIEVPSDRLALLNSGSSVSPTMAAWIRGTGWPGYRQLPEVAFIDVDDFDNLVARALEAGFVVGENAKSRYSLRMRDLQSQAGSGSTTLVARGRYSVRSRLLRRPYALWSPLAPDEVARRLSERLAPEQPFSLGLRRGPLYRGQVSGWSVRLASYGGVQRNSWRTVFEGTIAVNGPGCWLSGTIGPVGSLAVFSTIC